MTRKSITKLLVLISAVSAGAGVGYAAEDANDVFQSLFGEDMKRAQATRDTADDLALANTLIGAAKTSRSQEALCELLCNQAYALASRDTSKAGSDAAVAAMEQLAHLVPDKAQEAQEKILAALRARFVRADGAEKAQIASTLIEGHIKQGKVLEKNGDYVGAVKQYQSAKILARQTSAPEGPTIDALIDAATQRDRTERRIAQLEEKVAADPADKSQRLDLIVLYMQVDNPRAAVAHANQSGDEDVARWVTLATKKVSEVPVEHCGGLGEWYRGMADSADSDAAKRVVLGRAAGYLQRLIDHGRKDDLAVVKAKLTIGRLREDIAKLNATTPASVTTTRTTTDTAKKGDSIDLGKLIDPAKDAPEARWEKSGNRVGITLEGSTTAWLNLPVLPEGDYELQATWTRTTGRAVGKIFVPIIPKGGLKRSTYGSSYTPGISITLGLDDGKVGVIENGLGGSYYGYYYEDTFKNAIHSRAARFSNGKGYNVKVKVEHEKDEAKVTVLLGGDKYLAWRGDPAGTSVSVYRKAMPAVAIYSTVAKSSGVFSNLSIQATDGEIKKVRGE